MSIASLPTPAIDAIIFILNHVACKRLVILAFSILKQKCFGLIYNPNGLYILLQQPRLEEETKPNFMATMHFVVIQDKPGGRGGIRTHDLWLRRPTLYPAELPARSELKRGCATFQQGLLLPKHPYIYQTFYLGMASDRKVKKRGVPIGTPLWIKCNGGFLYLTCFLLR